MISTDRSKDRSVVRRVLGVLICALAVGALGLVAWGKRQSRPELLDQAIMLAESGKLDVAELKVREYLRNDPDRGAARLLLAQILLERTDSPSAPVGKQPFTIAQEALDHLSRVHPYNSRMTTAFELSRAKALYRLFRFDEAEESWLAALKVDPSKIEAGLGLLNLYYLESRQEESRQLALRLFRFDRDPSERKQVLLELLKQDVRPPAPGSVALGFEPVIRQHPREFHGAIALGLAEIRSGQIDNGIDRLRRVVRDHRDRIEGWDSLLTALDESGQVDELEEVLKGVPSVLETSPRLAKHRARVAQGRQWNKAVEFYRQALAVEPHNRIVEYQLSRALRFLGEKAEAERIELRLRSWDTAIQEIRQWYDLAATTSLPAARSGKDLFQRIAGARERMQLVEEARAWHQLVLLDDPKNDVSVSALARLKNEETAGNL
jgi:tetratricopeptide (TPR) repeat protein